MAQTSQKTVIRLVAALALALACICADTQPASAVESQDTPLLMIVVGFGGGSDGQPVPYNESYDWSAALFGGDSLNSFYSDMSGGAFTFAPALETCSADSRNVNNRADAANDGIVHVSIDEAYRPWGLVNEDTAVADDFAKIVQAAFDAAETYVDFDSYDSNHDRMITPNELAIIICIPGYDASALENPDRTDVPVMWPHSGKISHNQEIPADYEGFVIDSYIAITENLWYETEDLSSAEQEPMGIVYHELGHYLGLPDLYPLDIDPQAGAWKDYEVGDLSLMNSGGWAQARDSEGDMRSAPTAFDGWSRYMLGWKLPQIVTESGDYVVSSQQSATGYRSLLIPTADPDQYFLLENREPEAHDVAFRTSFENNEVQGGIVIWHIDKAMFREYGEQNELNNTEHRPGVMPVYFEADGAGQYSTDWRITVPDKMQPFFCSKSIESNLASESGSVELPLYSTDPSRDRPENRGPSGVTLTFPDDAARNMTVHVELGTEIAGSSSKAYPLDQKEAENLRLSEADLGRIACVALLEETDADIALVDAASLSGGLSSGSISFNEACSVLPDDSVIQVFDVTGTRLRALIERSLDINHACHEALKAGATLPQIADEALCIGGMDLTVDWEAPSGSRLQSAQLHGESLKNTATYRIATTLNVAADHGLLDAWGRNTLVLYGSPASALISLVQHDDWESTVQKRIGTHTYLEPQEHKQSDSTTSEAPAHEQSHAEASESSNNPSAQLLVSIAAICVAGFVVTLAALVVLGRKRR